VKNRDNPFDFLQSYILYIPEVNNKSQVSQVVDLLTKNVDQNMNILNFIESYPVHSYERVGDSVLVRGESDRPWTFISSASQTELKQLTKRFSERDIYFAAIEDWMVPFLTESKELVWDLDMIQFILPADVQLQKPAFQPVSLKVADAPYIFENSEYRNYLSVDYVRDRITRGPSAAIYENDKLIAWVMTQDDGAMGALHVLESHRNKGYGLQVTLGLCEEIKHQGKRPFAYVEKDNAAAIRLIRKIGFVEQKRVHWLQLK